MLHVQQVGRQGALRTRWYEDGEATIGKKKKQRKAYHAYPLQRLQLSALHHANGLTPCLRQKRVL